MKRLNSFLTWIFVICLVSGFCSSLLAEEEPEPPFFPAVNLIDFALGDQIRTTLWPDESGPEIAALRKLSLAQRKEFLAIYVDPSEADQADPKGCIARIKAKYQLALKHLLPPDEFTRLQQARWQYDGLRVVLDPAMVEALGITKEQLEKLANSEAELSPSNKENIQKMNGLDAKERNQILLEKHQQLRRKIGEILSAEQATKLEELKGPRFSSKLQVDPTSIKHRYTALSNMVLLASLKLVRTELGIAEGSAEVAPLNRLCELKRQERSAKPRDPWGVSFDHLNAKDEFQLRKILNADQMKRLRQIELQYTANSPFKFPYVQQALSLESDQWDKLDEVYREFTKKKVALSNSKEISESEKLSQRRALRAGLDQKTGEILIAEQMRIFAELKGKPIDVDQLEAEQREQRTARRKAAEKN